MGSSVVGSSPCSSSRSEGLTGLWNPSCAPGLVFIFSALYSFPSSLSTLPSLYFHPGLFGCLLLLWSHCYGDRRAAVDLRSCNFSFSYWAAGCLDAFVTLTAGFGCFFSPKAIGCSAVPVITAFSLLPRGWQSTAARLLPYRLRCLLLSSCYRY